MDEKSERGRELKEHEILVTSTEKMGTDLMQAMHFLNMSINTLIDGENLFINKQLINKKEELINYEHLFVGRKENLDPKGLEKYLNKTIWDKFKDDKCSLGVSFKKMCHTRNHFQQ
jgi:hypothetical protein